MTREPLSNVAMELVEKLTEEEKVQLLSAVDWWRTPVLQRHGIFVPHIKVSAQVQHPGLMIKSKLTECPPF